LKTVAILNSKGGVGKSTLCQNIARELQLRGNEVLVLDTDPLGDTTNWYVEGPDDFPAVVKVEGSIIRAAKHISKETDYLLIDGVAVVQKELTQSIGLSDYVLVPITPSPFDLNRAFWLSRYLIPEIVKRQGSFGAGAVVNRQKEHSNIASDGRLVEAVREIGIELFKSRTGDRVTYPEAALLNSSVMDIEPKGKAAKEIRAITDELVKRIP